MKLTLTQVNELYSFVRKHYVVHYDLQTELVDHLANGIEEQWQHNPERTFKESCFIEFRKFGVAGFQDTIDNKTSAIRKKYRNIVWSFYKDYFSLPKILLILCLVLIITISLILIPLTFRYNMIIGVFFLILLAIFYLALKKRNVNELENVKYGKKWMLKDQIHSYEYLLNILNILPITLNFRYIRDNIPMDNLWVLVSFAIVITLTIILTYVTIFVIPSKADELLVKTYPEYKIF